MNQAVRGFVELGQWFSTAFAGQALATLRSVQDPNRSIDEKSTSVARLWGASMSAVGLTLNEIVDASAVLAEDPTFVASHAIPLSGFPASAAVGPVVPRVLGEHLENSFGLRIPTDRCWFVPDRIDLGPNGGQPAEVVLMVDLRGLRSGSYPATIVFEPLGGGPEAHRVDVLAAL